MSRRIQLVAVICLLPLLAVACAKPGPTPQTLIPTALGRGAPVAVSSDGQLLLVVRAEPEWNEGWLQPTGGGAGNKILQFTATSFSAAFSPDGRHLAYSADGLWLAAADGTSPVQIVPDPTAGALAWSPNSDRLAIVLQEKVQLVDLQGKIVAEVVAADSVRALGWSRLSQGERLFFASFPDEEPPYVAAVATDGQGLTRLAVAETFDLAGDLLFVAEPLSAGPLRRLSALDGSSVQTVVESGVQAVAVRPAAREVAYIKQNEDGVTSDLWLASADGQEQRQLTAGAPILGLNWSPDGKRLYFAMFDVQAGEEDDPFQVQVLDIP